MPYLNPAILLRPTPAPDADLPRSYDVPYTVRPNPLSYIFIIGRRE